MNETFSAQQTSPFPEGPSESARTPQDPLIGDWAEGLRAPLRELAIPKPRIRVATAADSTAAAPLLGASTGAADPAAGVASTTARSTPPGVVARSAMAAGAEGASDESDNAVRTEQLDLRALEAMREEENAKAISGEVEAPEAWASAEADQLASVPPPPRSPVAKSVDAEDGAAHEDGALGDSHERKDEVMLLSDEQLADEDDEILPAFEPPSESPKSPVKPAAAKPGAAKIPVEKHGAAAGVKPAEARSDPGKRNYVDATTLALVEKAHSESKHGIGEEIDASGPVMLLSPESDLSALDATAPAMLLSTENELHDDEPHQSDATGQPLLLSAENELLDGDANAAELLLSPESALPDEPESDSPAADGAHATSHASAATSSSAAVVAPAEAGTPAADAPWPIDPIAAESSSKPGAEEHGSAKSADPWSAAFEEAASEPNTGAGEGAAKRAEPGDPFAGASTAVETLHATDPIETLHAKDSIETLHAADSIDAPESSDAADTALFARLELRGDPSGHSGVSAAATASSAQGAESSPADPFAAQSADPFAAESADPFGATSGDPFAAGASDPFTELGSHTDPFSDAPGAAPLHEVFGEVTSLGTAFPPTRPTVAESSPWEGPSVDGEINWAPALGGESWGANATTPAHAAAAASFPSSSAPAPVRSPAPPAKSAPTQSSPPILHPKPVDASWEDPAAWEAQTVRAVSLPHITGQSWTPADAEWTTGPSAPVKPTFAHAGSASQPGSESPFAALAPGASLAGDDEPVNEHGLTELGPGDMLALPEDADLLSPLSSIDAAHDEKQASRGALLLKGEHRVAIQTRGGATKRGLLRDADLSAAKLSLHPASGSAPTEIVSSSDVKAIFFMLAPGERGQPGNGARVRITFVDGRTLDGTRDGIDAREGFFIVPADASRTNTKRIYVARAALLEIKDG